jgi:preprotein translocase subunit SecD
MASGLLLVGGCNGAKSAPKPLAKTATFDVYVVSPMGTPSMQRIMDPDRRTPLFLLTPAILSAADVATIQRSDDTPGTPTLTVNLTPAGARKLAAATANPAGMQLALVAKGTVLAAPKVTSPLSAKFQVSSQAIATHGEQWVETLTKN